MKSHPSDKTRVFVETGTKRTFAASLQWPGWCRAGRDENAALENLLAYAPRYAQVVRSLRPGFQAPHDRTELAVVERLKGTTTTDFGAPDCSPKADARPPDDNELKSLLEILRACWRAFDGAVRIAGGRTLRTGPRGGGRTLDEIIRHDAEAKIAYLSRLGGKPPAAGEAAATLEILRKEILSALKASAHGEIPSLGPRGGKRWTARFFIRREAWHALDHAWEIEDRLSSPDS
jgi:hypothetical protein